MRPKTGLEPKAMETHPERHPEARRRAACAVLAVVLAAGASCARYTPRHTPASVAPPATLEAAVLPAAPAPAAPAPVTDLTLEELLRLAVARNTAVEVSAYDVHIAAQAVPEARAAFDPTLSATVRYGERNTPGTAGANQTAATTTGAGAVAGPAGTEGLTAALTAVQTLVTQLSRVYGAVSEPSVVVDHTATSSAGVTISWPQPTGTIVSVSGDYAGSDSEGAAAEHSGSWTVAVTQALLRDFGTDVNLVALRQAKNAEAIAGLAFREQVLGLLNDTESAYWELALARRTLDIRRAGLTLAEEQLARTDAQIALGKLYGKARVSAEAEVAAQEAALRAAEAAVEQRATDLWLLVNPEDTAADTASFGDIALPDPPAAECDFARSAALARVFRPDLGQARLATANGDLSVLAARNGLLPRLDGFVSYGLNSQGTGSGAWSSSLDDRTYEAFEAGVNFEMTLGNRAEKARLERARLQVRQAEARVRHLERSADAEVRAAVTEVQSQRAQTAAARKEAAAREEALAVASESFRLGRSDSLDVLQAQRDYIAARVSEATAVARSLQALSALHRAEGTLAARHGIVLETLEEDL